MIDKAIEGSIIKTYIKTLRLHRGDYECSDAGVSKGMMDLLCITFY